MRIRRELHERIRGLPLDRLRRLASAREAALAGTAERFFPAQPRLPWVRLGAVAGAVALSWGATFWFGSRPDPGVDIAPLAAAGKPASRYSAEAGLVAHPDFALVADPDAEHIARDIALLSWSAAQADAEAAARDPLAPLVPQEMALMPLDESPSDAP
jgi:hypothetical protein